MAVLDDPEFRGAAMRLRFGKCVLDSGTRELFLDGAPVHLQPKAFEFLELLIRNRPRVVPKAEIHENLWSETFVSDGTLTSLMAEVRTAIGDEARQPCLVRTVHRVGYAFCGEAVEIGDRANAVPGPEWSCWLIRGRRRYALAAGKTVVGRDPGAAVSLPDASVSRRHAVLHVAPEQVLIEDLGSKNGTYVQDQRVRAAIPLSDGDRVRFGSIELTFRQFVMPDSTRTAVGPAGSDRTPS
jgi:DNA-binding winged helix-turn-helix (wHTH) protein